MKRHAEDFDRDAEATPMEVVRSLLGEDLALKLSEDFGGRRLYVPRQAGEHHPLAASVGVEPANRLCAVLAQRFIELPLSPGKHARIVALAAQGATRHAIAREMKVSERHVYRVLASAEAPDGGQGRLF